MGESLGPIGSPPTPITPPVARPATAPQSNAPAGAPQPASPTIGGEIYGLTGTAQLEATGVSGVVDVPLPPPSLAREVLDEAAMTAGVMAATQAGLLAAGSAAAMAMALGPLGIVAAAAYLKWKSPEEATHAEPALLKNLEALAKAPPATSPDLPGGWETSAAAQKILDVYGIDAGKTNREFDAMSLIITARGGDKPVSAAQQQKALKEIQQVLGLKQPPNAEQLRDLDHYINNYKSIRSQNPVFGLAVAGVDAVTTVLYTGGKAIGHELGEIGIDPLKTLSGGEFTSNGDNTSKPSGHEIIEGLKGVVDGVIDGFTKVPMTD